MDLKNKKILLVIGGGISAYKSLDLIRLLQRKSCSVKVILTKTGKKFVHLCLFHLYQKIEFLRIHLVKKIMVKWIILVSRDGLM